MLSSLEDLATQVLQGDRQLVGALRTEGRTLLEYLRRHTQWEDAHVAPALREAGTDGDEQAARLQREHREQRELLRHVLETVEDQRRPSVLIARNLIDLVEVLRRDMDEEEKAFARGPVFRRDGIVADVEIG